MRGRRLVALVAFFTFASYGVLAFAETPLAKAFTAQSESALDRRESPLMASSDSTFLQSNVYAASAPQVTSLSTETAERSGRLLINGTSFGAAQNDGRVEIGGATAHISRWSDTLIAAYVPETAAVGSNLVRVVTGAGVASNSVPLNVSTRPSASGRIRWRFTMDSDYAMTRSAVGLDGTVYVHDVGGNLYALTPDGALKWIYHAGLRGGYGPVAVGLDGTLYIALLEPKPDGTLGNTCTIHAVNPDGTRKWVFNGTTGTSIIAGPSVGPDGNIYSVDSAANGLGLFALSPEGRLLYRRDSFFERRGLGHGQEIVFGPSNQMYFGFNWQERLYSYSLDGNLRFSATALSPNEPFQAAIGPNGVVYAQTFPTGLGKSLGAFNSSGTQLWNFYEYPGNAQTTPDVGADNTIYMGRNLSTLLALNSDGTVKWRYTDSGILYDPVVSPNNDLVFMGGRVSYSEPGFFMAVSTTGEPLWKVYLPTEPGFAPYGDQMPSSRPRFSADGNTAYVATDILGDGQTNAYSYFYAVDTSAGNTPVNTPPVVNITSPRDGASFPNRSDIVINADATDDGAIAKVDFFYNSRGTTTFIGTDTTAPYSATLSGLGPDVYGLYAVAYDDKGARTISSIHTVVVNNAQPVVTINSPASGASFTSRASITLSADAVDSDGTITKVEFYNNQTGLVATDTSAPYTVEWPNVAEGTYEIYAWATDNDGARAASGPITITVVAAPAPTPTPTPTATPTPTPTPTPSPVVLPTPTPTATPSPSPTPTPSPSPLPVADCIGFAQSNFVVSENAGHAVITVTRSASAPVSSQSEVTVTFETSDAIASSRTDFMPMSASLTFKPGETSKSFIVPITDDAYMEGSETINLALRVTSGSQLCADATRATLTIEDNDVSQATTNPADAAYFFVRQHYIDFLNREPDQGGWDYWTGVIAQCGADENCINSRRVAVSAAYFIELEFQDTGSYVYRLHKASYGQQPGYSQFMPDRSQLVTIGDLNAAKQQFTEAWVQRSSFIAKYPIALNGSDFISALIDTVKQGSGIDLSSHTSELLTEYNAGASQVNSRARVLGKLIAYQEFQEAEYNRAFVLMQYFGYLRRDADAGGYNFWLDVLNNKLPGDSSGYRSMVCAFITSAEYQQRFSPVVTRNDHICGSINQ